MTVPEGEDMDKHILQEVITNKNILLGAEKAINRFLGMKERQKATYQTLQLRYLSMVKDGDRKVGKAWKEARKARKI